MRFSRQDITTWIRTALQALAPRRGSDIRRELLERMGEDFPRLGGEALSAAHVNATVAELKPPDVMSPEAVGSIDLFGTVRLREHKAQAVNGAGAASFVDGSVVPKDEVWYVFAAHATHDDTVSRYIYLVIKSPLLDSVAITEAHQASAGTREDTRPAVLTRPLYLPPGCSLGARSRTALTAAKVLTLAYLYVSLPLGEYTAPL